MLTCLVLAAPLPRGALTEPGLCAGHGVLAGTRNARRARSLPFRASTPAVGAARASPASAIAQWDGLATTARGRSARPAVAGAAWETACARATPATSAPTARSRSAPTTAPDMAPAWRPDAACALRGGTASAARPHRAQASSTPRAAGRRARRAATAFAAPACAKETLAGPPAPSTQRSNAARKNRARRSPCRRADRCRGRSAQIYRKI